MAKIIWFIILLLVSILMYVYLMLNKSENEIITKMKHHVMKSVDEVFAEEDACRKKQWKLSKDFLERENKKKSHRLPNIIGIGAAKCGTHALFQYLGYHPLSRHRAKIEMHFFSRSNNIQEYINLLPKVEDSSFLMEKTPAYFDYPPFDVPQKIKSGVPGVKLLLILCDPVKRTLSDFYQKWAMYEAGLGSNKITSYNTLEDYLQKFLPMIRSEFGTSNMNDSTAFRKEFKSMQLIHETSILSSLLTTGLYALHLRRWLKLFNKSDLMIINGDDLFHNPGIVIEEVQEFVGMPKLLLRQDFVQDKNGFYCFKDLNNRTRLNCLPPEKQRTRNKIKLSNSTRDILSAFYKPHNQELYKMIGRNFHWE